MDDILKERLVAAELTVEEYNGFTDESIEDDEISWMKKHEVKRPPKVSHGRWMQPKELTARHYKMINLAANGSRASEIAEVVGMSLTKTQIFLAAPLVKKKIAARQALIFEDMTAPMKMLFNRAFGTIEAILEDHDEKSSIKLEAAKYVIDHVIGKATQTVKHEGTSLLGEFMKRLDNERAVVEKIKSTPIEPEYVAIEVKKETADEASATALKVLENSKDDMDTLVESIIQKDFVVGRRDKDGSQS